ncbi:aminotransferase [Nocardioides korecus]
MSAHPRELVDLPAPQVDADWAVRTVAAHFGGLGREVVARGLGSNQDANFLLTSPAGEPVAVLKVSNPVFTLAEVEAQDRAADAIAAARPDLRVAQVLRGSDGAALRAFVDTPDGPAVARLVRFLGGGTLADRGHLSRAVVARLGELAALVDVALAGADLDVPEPARLAQWDPRHAADVLAALGASLPEDRRARVLAAAADAWDRVAALADQLPLQVVHLDLTDDNTVLGPGRLDGVIDLGDLTRTWTVAELAITISSVLHHPGNAAVDVLPAVRAFHAVRPLSAAEVDALWPLVVLRAAVLVASGCHQTALDGDNAYAETRLVREWRITEQALSLPAEVMTGVLRAGLGLPSGAGALPESHGPVADLVDPADQTGPSGVEVLDLGSTSPLVDEGAWRDPDVVDRVVGDLLGVGRRAVVTRWGEARLAGTTGPAHEAPATVATGVDLWTAAPTDLRAPWAGRVTRDEHGRVVLAVDDLDLVLSGLSGRPDPAAGTTVAAGEVLGTTTPGSRVRITLGRDAARTPEAVAAAYAPGWLAGVLDPAPLLGLAPTPAADVVGSGTADALLRRRERTVAEVQEHYYRTPPRVERGWRHHLVTDEGRPLLDMINNVAIVGHSHPRIAAVAARQLRLLNTNSRFHYGAIAEFADRLGELLPDPLDTVFLVNSGSEATDLALRLAMVGTGRHDVVAMAEAYHGWTYASDAVSTSVADNPHALETRPDWVHTVPAANPYRGAHRGSDAGRYAPEAVARIDALAAAGRPPAAFVAEAYYGNAGGMALPDGYLAQVYAAVRRHGGLAVADEVQVGYGRLGHWRWGFEQQGVVPDVVAVAKGVGNGSPVGAVVTTRAVADAYRGAGYFFSSAGGSPVSSRIGLAVLDVLRDEGLQDNARVVGDHLATRLRELVARHDLVGAVHGHGLYLGVELVRDLVTLEPAAEETAAICERMLELGVVVQPTSDRQNVLKIKPPLCLDVASADFFVDTLDRVLGEGW